MNDSRFDLHAEVARAKALYKSGDHAGAAATFRACIVVAPDQAALWSHLASVLRKQRHFAASLTSHRRALELDPANRVMRRHYANALCDAGAYAEAIEVRRALLEDAPDDPVSLGQLCEALHCNRMQAEVVSLLDQAETVAPLDEKLILQRAIANLAMGNWARGFAEFESRYFNKSFVRDGHIRWQQWRGEDLQGKSILVLPEQGFGDAIFSARFFGALKAQGANVTVVASAPTERLLQSLDTVDVVRRRVDKHDRFDRYSYAMSIPHRLGFDGTNVPPPPTFAIPASALKRAKAITHRHRDRFNIGMVWTGSSGNPINIARATTPDRFLRFADLKGVQLFSLYKGDQIGELEATGTAGIILNACQQDADFAETAGVIAQMDLVITTDTAVAHLAGALGKPTWVLLSHQGFWYFGYGDTTPWYPSMRLYHQTAHRDWDGVFDRVQRDLSTLLSGLS